MPANLFWRALGLVLISMGSLIHEVEIATCSLFSIWLQFSCSSECAVDDLADHFGCSGEVGASDWVKDTGDSTRDKVRAFFSDSASRVEAMQQKHLLRRGVDGKRFPASVLHKQELVLYLSYKTSNC